MFIYLFFELTVFTVFVMLFIAKLITFNLLKLVFLLFLKPYDTIILLIRTGGWA